VAPGAVRKGELGEVGIRSLEGELLRTPGRVRGGDSVGDRSLSEPCVRFLLVRHEVAAVAAVAEVSGAVAGRDVMGADAFDAGGSGSAADETLAEADAPAVASGGLSQMKPSEVLGTPVGEVAGVTSVGPGACRPPEAAACRREQDPRDISVGRGRRRDSGQKGFKVIPRRWVVEWTLPAGSCTTAAWSETTRPVLTAPQP
jgi:hypothetical protein